MRKRCGHVTRRKGRLEQQCGHSAESAHPSEALVHNRIVIDYAGDGTRACGPVPCPKHNNKDSSCAC